MFHARFQRRLFVNLEPKAALSSASTRCPLGLVAKVLLRTYALRDGAIERGGWTVERSGWLASLHEDCR